MQVAYNIINNSAFRFLLAGLIALSALLLNLGIEGPMIQADEGGYIANAAAIAGFFNNQANSYHPGYSLILSPAFLIADNPSGIWLGIKIINSILLFIGVLLLWKLSFLLNFRASVGRRGIAVSLVSLYPMWIVMVGYAFSQIAFFVVFLLVVISLYNAIEKGKYWWIVLGAVVAFLYWIHPTAVPTIIALLILVGFTAWRQRSLKVLLGFIFSFVLNIGFYKLCFIPWLFVRMTNSGFEKVDRLSLHYANSAVSSFFTPLLSLDGLGTVISRFAGHLFYLTIGTIGLIWLSFFLTVQQSYKIATSHKEKQISPEFLTYCFIWMALLGTIALSSLLFSRSGSVMRLDHWMYGRYVEPILAPILLVGALSTSYKKIIWAIPIAIFCAVILSLNLDEFLPAIRVNIPSFWQDIYIGTWGLWGWLLTGIIPILIIALTPQRLGYVVLCILFICFSLIHINWHDQHSQYHSSKRDAAHKIRKMYPRGTCVGFDTDGLNSPEKFAFWVEFGTVLFDYDLRMTKASTWENTCDGPLFSYNTELDDEIDGVATISLSTQGGPLLWERSQNRPLYPINLEKQSGDLSVFQDGWHGAEPGLIWSGRKGLLTLKIPDYCGGEGICFALIKYFVFGASLARPVKVIFQSNVGGLIEKNKFIITNWSPQLARIPLNNKFHKITINIEVPSATSPKELYGKLDTRILGIAVREIDIHK